jgi:hypothetical protein
MQDHQDNRIPVRTPYGIEWVSEQRARCIALGSNARVVRSRSRSRQILRIELYDQPGADLHEREAAIAAGINRDQRLIHDSETGTNPAGVWEHKHHLTQVMLTKT